MTIDLESNPPHRAVMRTGAGRCPAPFSTHLRALLWCAALAAFVPAPATARTLKEAFDAAAPAGGYDKWVELETGVTYRGGLLIGPVLNSISNTLEGDAGLDVRIVGNGAILDLQGQQLCISYCNNRLDLDDCVILHGNVRFRGMNNSSHQVMPTGTVRYVTFYGPHDYGIRLQGVGDGITLERNLLVDALDTGPDFLYTNGISHEWLPTGSNISFSVQEGFYGTPVITENWTYHTDPETNASPIAHFSRLCEYG